MVRQTNLNTCRVSKLNKQNKIYNKIASNFFAKKRLLF